MRAGRSPFLRVSTVEKIALYTVISVAVALSGASVVLRIAVTILTACRVVRAPGGVMFAQPSQLELPLQIHHVRLQLVFTDCAPPPLGVCLNVPPPKCSSGVRICGFTQPPSNDRFK